MARYPEQTGEQRPAGDDHASGAAQSSRGWNLATQAELPRRGGGTDPWLLPGAAFAYRVPQTLGEDRARDLSVGEILRALDQKLRFEAEEPWFGCAACAGPRAGESSGRAWQPGDDDGGRDGRGLSR